MALHLLTPRLRPGDLTEKKRRDGQGTKAAGMADLAKNEARLEEISKATLRMPPSDLDVAAAAALYLKSLGVHTTKRKIYRELQSAIARGELNAPFTAGAR